MKFIQFHILVLLLAGAARGQATRPAVVSIRLDELKQLKAEVERLRDEVGRLRKENAKLREEADKPVDDKIAAAIKEGRLAVGMTLAEARKAMGRNGVLVYEDREVQRYSWDVFVDAGSNRLRFSHKESATFKDDKLIQHSK